MGIERKDVRAKFDSDAHAQLQAVAEHDGKDIGEWVEHLVLSEIARRYAAARSEASLAGQLERLGISGKTRELSLRVPE